MSKNGPGKNDKGKGKAPKRPPSPDIKTPSDQDSLLKPHKCPKCPKRFISRGHMTRHAKGSHGLDCSGQEWLQWDPLETLAFKAEQVAAQRRKRNRKAA